MMNPVTRETLSTIVSFCLAILLIGLVAAECFTVAVLVIAALWFPNQAGADFLLLFFLVFVIAAQILAFKIIGASSRRVGQITVWFTVVAVPGVLALAYFYRGAP
jgi:hypothetical protein